MMELTELKPCPFCGGEATNSTGHMADGTPWPYVECLDCAASSEPANWNLRAPAKTTTDPILTRLDLIGELTSPEYISRLRGVMGRGAECMQLNDEKIDRYQRALQSECKHSSLSVMINLLCTQAKLTNQLAALINSQRTHIDKLIADKNKQQYTLERLHFLLKTAQKMIGISDEEIADAVKPLQPAPPASPVAGEVKG